MAAKELTNPGQYTVSNRLKTVYASFCFLGLLAFVVTLINNPQRAWLAYLLPLFYFTSLALGGLFFASIQHVTKAGWSVNIRRISESFTAFLPLAALFTLIFLAGTPEIYKWLKPEKVAADPLLVHKAPYLNATFFVIRVVLFFGLWLWFKKLIVGRSLEQDKTGDVNITHKLVGTSIGFILVFALSYSFFSVDLLMSLEPHWFSTIFGVYTFAGLFQSTLAFLILTLLYLKSKGLMQSYVTADHLHDLGKFLFAFTVFWAYIAFSQYMLIWYANLPEETIFIIPRTENAWLYVSIALLLGKFIIPFLALLPRWAKRTPSHLAAVSVLILVMQYVDLYWLIYPTFFEESLKFSLSEILIFLGFLGAFLFAVSRFLSRNQLVPLKDPRIHESLHHHVVY
jgi:hypothetical protein